MKVRNRTGGQRNLAGRASIVACLACIMALTVGALAVFWTARASSAQGGMPDRQFFEDYIKEEAKTFFQYRTHGIGPFLSMTLANNRAFQCITSGGRVVDFEGYVEIYKYTFENFVYQRISPVKVVIEHINDDEILVTYTMSMAGKTRAGTAWEVERDNKYTFVRIEAGDTAKLRELDPQNLEKYFGRDEDKWIITKIQYG